MVRYIIDISPILDTGCLDQGEISVHYILYYIYDYITLMLQHQYGGPLGEGQIPGVVHRVVVQKQAVRDWWN